jgi:outer membrane protein TolC
MTRRILGALVLATLSSLAAASAVGAQSNRASVAAPVDSNPLPLSLDDAIQRAVNQSQEVRLARAQVDLAASQVTAARAAALPQLDASVLYTRTFASPFGGGGGISIPDSLRFEPDPTAPIEERVAYLEDNAETAGLAGLGALFGNLPFGRKNSYIAALSGSQLLYSGGRTGAAMRIARAYNEAARFNYTEQVADIQLSVRRAYYNAALAQELESIAAAALQQAQAFLQQETLRFEAGAASELQVLRAEVSAENLRPQVVEARNAAELATLDLKRLIDIPLEQPVRLTTALTAPAPNQVTTTDVTGDLARRAAVSAAERQLDITREQVSIARGAFLPQLSLSVNYGGQLFPSTAFNIGAATWNKDISASVRATIPIFSGFRRKAELAQAHLAVTQAELQLGQLREAVQLEAEQARGERERALASIAARQRTVQQAQRVHDLTVLRYESGLATQLEVSDARLALLQARTNVVQAIADYYIADAGYSRALGRPTAS